MTEPWIASPGFYDLTDLQYHADPVVGGSLSSTGARTLITKTAAHFNHERRNGRPDKAELDFGKVAHARVLGRGTDVQVIVGTGKDRNAWRTAEDKANVAKARAAGKTPIKLRDHQAITAMADALRDHPTAGPLLARPGRHEQAAVWRDPATGVWCRLMADFLPDVAPPARLIVVDYKTAVDASPEAFAKAVANNGYDQQADWYDTGLQTLDPRDEPPQFVFIVQEKTAPFLVSVHFLDDLAMARGRWRNERARELYAACSASGRWPGYSEDPIELSLPVWAARDFEAARDAASFAEQFGDPA